MSSPVNPPYQPGPGPVQPPPGGPYVHPQAPAKRRRNWPAILGALCLGFLLGLLTNCGGDSTTAAPGPTVTTTATQGGQESGEASAPAQQAASTITDGTGQEVGKGKDVEPGSYKVQANTDLCYFQVSTEENGEDIKSNGTGQGSHRVKLNAGEFFDTQDCGTWQRVK